MVRLTSWASAVCELFHAAGVGVVGTNFGARLIVGVILAIIGGVAGQSWAAPPLAGKLVYLQGQVAIRRGGAGEWVAAQPGEPLFSGDAVMTGPASRASLLCVDESQIKLNENTILVLKRVASSPRLRLIDAIPSALESVPRSIYQVLQGEMWLRNNKENFRFELETPAVTATIRGTEFNLRVQPNGATSVILLQGNLCLTNSQGEVCLLPGEEGITFPGQAPIKRLLVQPSDAVQWCLYYPGLISYRDLPLSDLQDNLTSGAKLMTSAWAAYDQGRLSEAQQLAEHVLQQVPEQPLALTLLGWINLQNHRPQEAAALFEKVSSPDWRCLIGQSLARYRRGDPVGAYRLFDQGRRGLPPSPFLAVMSGYFTLMVGKASKAQRELAAVANLPPSPAVVWARSLLAQIHIVQNRKDAALAEACQALAQAPGSPLAHLTMGLVKISFFDQTAARLHLEKALALDPGLVDGYLYLARLWLGADHLARAWQTVSQALRLAPREGEVLSLAGFIRLAYRDYAGACQFFHQAIAANPRFGEPHLGLGIYYFRHRKNPQALTEMLTATLLDPRVSSYQSELGKAFYQVRAFDKALEVYDYAAALDPRDPTPHLYKGIALSDLYRPGEAIQEINRSIALNDNAAIFRTRLALDRDLAVRNYNLARAYNQLGLNHWGYSKAVTAVKKDPLNSSAHQFLGTSYEAENQIYPAEVERLLFRLLAPANQNAFIQLNYNDYASMFEMPYIRTTLQAGGGCWNNKNSLQEYLFQVYGGRPGLAFFGNAFYSEDEGYRIRNNDSKGYNLEGAVKWEPTINATLLGFVQHRETLLGDLFDLNDFGYQPSKYFRYHWRWPLCEAGYVHRFGPRATLLTYFSHQKLNLRTEDFYPSPPDNYNVVADWNCSNAQVQQQIALGNHTFIAGFDYFSGNLHNRAYYSWFGEILNQSPPERTWSLYLLDYWRLLPNLIMELGVSKDFAKNSRYWYSEPLSNSLWSGRLGLNYEVTSTHTLRLALERHLDTHTFFQPLLAPADVASFPVYVDAEGGDLIRQAGFAWEAQWDAKTFSTLRLQALRQDNPNYDESGYRTCFTWRKYQATLLVNRILSPYWGLALGGVYKKNNFNYPGYDDFAEVYGLARISFLHRTGWYGAVEVRPLYQDVMQRSDNFFTLVDLRLGKWLANKRGRWSLEVNNLFDRRFYYALDPLRNTDFFPSRRLLCKFALYF